MAKFKWADEYKKRGFEVFSPETIKSLRAIQRKYRFDYRTFFMTVEEAFEGTSFTKERKRVNDILKKIDEIYSLVDDLLKVSQPLDESSLEKLFNLTNEVDEDFRFFSNPENITVASQKRIQEAEKKSGIKSSDIVQTNKLIKAKILKAGDKRQAVKSPSPFAPAMKPIGEGIKQTLYGMAGPFQPVLRAAEKGISGVGKAIEEQKQRKVEAQQLALDRATLLSEEATPEFLGAYRQLGIEGLGGLSKRAKSGLRKRVEGARQPISSMKDMPSMSLSSKSRIDKRSQDALGQALFTFFHKDAFRANWTKELLEKVSGKKGAGKTGSIFDDVIEQVKGTAIVAGKIALGLASAGAAIAGLGKGAFYGTQKSEKEGWLTGKPGTKQTWGQNLASDIGTGFGGRGPGIFDKGTVGQKAKNIGWQSLLGGALAGGVATLLTIGTGGAAAPLIAPAAAWGAGAGAGLGAVGGKKISQGLQGLGRIVTFKNPKTGESFFGNKEKENVPMPVGSSKEENESLKKTFSDGIEKLIEAIKSPRRAPAFEQSGKDTDSIRNPVFSEMQ